MRKIRFQDIYGYLVSLWGFLYVFVNFTTFTRTTGISLGGVLKVYSIVAYVLVLLKAAVDYGKENRRQRAAILIIAVIMFLSRMHTSNTFLMSAMIFIIGSRNVDMKQCLKKIMHGQAAVIALTILLYYAGFLKDATMVRDGRIRSSVGFSHPNSMGNLLLQLCLLMFYFYHRKKPGRVYLVLFVAMYFCVVKADSRTSSYLLILLLVCQVITTFMNSRNRILTRVNQWLIDQSGILFIAVTVFSLLTSLGVVNIGLNDQTLKARFELMANYMGYYRPNLFGRDLYFGYQDDRATANSSLRWSLRTLDNSYIYLLLGLGIVVTVWFVFMYLLRLRMARRQGDYALLAVAVIYIIWGMMETALIRLEMNYFMLLFADVIWQMGKSPGHKDRRKRRVSIHL